VVAWIRGKDKDNDRHTGYQNQAREGCRMMFQYFTAVHQKQNQSDMALFSV
jgi:hypothetical protein